MTNTLYLRRLGKLLEELGELSNVAARCIIQGIDETDPGTGKANRRRLEDEIADVSAQLACTVAALSLNRDVISDRTCAKIGQMNEWEAMFKDEPAGEAIRVDGYVCGRCGCADIIKETK